MTQAIVLPICRVCSEKYYDYEIHDEVWNQLYLLDDTYAWQCTKCVELEIGRPLEANDFKRRQINTPHYIRHCDCCEKVFRPVMELHWYCSRACGDSMKYVVHVVCAYCERRFVPGRKDQRFCSAGCAWADRRKEHPDKECQTCHELFTPRLPDQKFCGRDCALQAKRAVQQEKECPICRESFMPVSKRQKYCAKEACRREGFNRTRRRHPRPASLISFNKFFEPKTD